ncbi:heme-binding protein 1-like [Palaemon carinicauda]|uniref:heme-binding protein 1-like n=1 Tax=Palaemon carinicauda TaxID=392227 RepID=UPI0035B6A817
MKWFVAFAVLLAAAATAQAGVIGDITRKISSLYGSHEEPPYELVREESGYEERKYPEKKWACIKTVNNNANIMEPFFWRLFKYFSGHNKEGTYVYMTAPVTTEYRVIEAANKEYTMCFYLGEEFQSNPPTPVDQDIFIQNRRELVVLTRTVGGYFGSEEHWLEEAGKLAAIIVSNGEHVALDHQYWAGYDAPLKFWGRRNEVWFLKYS